MKKKYLEEKSYFYKYAPVCKAIIRKEIEKLPEI
jgi:hypothetical protein